MMVRTCLMTGCPSVALAGGRQTQQPSSLWPENYRHSSLSELIIQVGKCVIGVFHPKHSRDRMSDRHPLTWLQYDIPSPPKYTPSQPPPHPCRHDSMPSYSYQDPPLPHWTTCPPPPHQHTIRPHPLLRLHAMHPGHGPRRVPAGRCHLAGRGGG